MAGHQHPQRIRDRGDCSDLHAATHQCRLDDTASIGIIVEHDGAPAGKELRHFGTGEIIPPGFGAFEFPVRISSGHRKLDDKCASCSRSIAHGPDAATVHLDKIAHYRQSQAEASFTARDARIRLAESLEDIREEVPVDADAGVCDAYCRRRCVALKRDNDPAAGRGELDGVGEKIPEDLLQSLGITGYLPRLRTGDIDTDLLRARHGQDRRHCCIDHIAEPQRCDVELHLACGDARHIEHILYQT